jgi:ferredoxin-NADP reductase
MRKAPSLSISPEKVFFIIAKSRQSDSTATELNANSGSADDDAVHGSRDRSKITDRSELSGFIRDLNVDEQIDLVALMWLGRGDGELDNWEDLRAEASRAHNNRTASYLIETPMLADYLEEALSQFGKSPEDFEEPL